MRWTVQGNPSEVVFSAFSSTRTKLNWLERVRRQAYSEPSLIAGTPWTLFVESFLTLQDAHTGK